MTANVDLEQSPATATSFEPVAGRGELLGIYRIEGVLGQGGMGEVLLGWDERLKRFVAIKRIRTDKPLDARRRARFLREARAVARLNHPAIVQIYDIFESDGGDCIVMEYLEGASLDRLIAGHGIGLRTAVKIAAEISDGLGEAHAKGLVHRDLKAANVIVTTAGHAKILDFGLVRALWRHNPRSETATFGSSRLTQTGTLLGTAQAMSPEQAVGQPVDHRSDLFAFGILLYEMVTGRPPFHGRTLIETLGRVATETPLPVAELQPQAPPELTALIDALLEKNPARRPRNARLVAAELERIAAALTGMIEIPPAPLERAPAGGLDVGEVGDLSTASALMPLAQIGSSLVEPRVLVAVEPEAAGPLTTAVARRLERVERELLGRFGGQAVDGLTAFESCADAVGFALACHHARAELSRELDTSLVARVAIHLGEVFSHRPPASREAPAISVESASRVLLEQLASLAVARQTLLTRAAFDLARHAANDDKLKRLENLCWLAHGSYTFRDHDDPHEIFEVGAEDAAPLHAPPGTEGARRAVRSGDELTLGWRPAAGQPIPRRPNWVLKERLGAGGFGEVWLVRHKTGEQRVLKFCFAADRLRALKREVTLFRLLKDALGHRRDIARILDWSFDQPPYFVESEYSEGGNLSAWAERQGGIDALPLEQRLELIAGVAEALAAAHSVGVLHKDVKPENVLIRLDPRDGPYPQLTDFGLGHVTETAVLEARGISASGIGQTTDDGSSGTLRYMAPERLEGKPATVQSDLYSVGVMLYQAAVGDFSRVLASGWQRQLDDDLLTEDIARLVDGTPERRPASAARVARDLRALEERRLRREAERRARARARADHLALERAQERRRMALAVAAGAVALLALMLVVTYQVLGARGRERAAREEAELRRQQAEGLIDFMLGDLREKLTPIGRLAILEDVGDQALAYFAAVPPDRLSDQELLSHARALDQLGHVETELGRFDVATKAFRESLDLARRLAARDPADDERLFQLGQSHFWVGYLLWQQRDLEAALVQFRAYERMSRQLAAKDPSNQAWQLELAYSHSNVGQILELRGDPEPALAELRRSAAIFERLLEDDAGSASLRHELAHVQAKVAYALRQLGELEAARRQYEEILEQRRSLLEEAPDDAGRLDHLATAHHHLGEISRLLGDHDRAAVHYRRDLEILERLVARDPMNRAWRWSLGMAHVGVARAALGRGEPALSREHLENGREAMDELLESDPSHEKWRLHLASALGTLASLELLERRAAPARAAIGRALVLLDPLGDPREGDAGDDRALRLVLTEVLWNQGRIESLAGAVDAARDAWMRAAAVAAPLVSERDPEALAARARPLLALDRLTEACSAVERLAALGARGVDLGGFEQRCPAS